MSHIVIHDDQDGVTQYRQFDDLQSSVEYLEELHNTDGVDDPRLYSLSEVEFEVKSYLKVEIGGTTAEPADEVTRIPASEPEILPTAEDVDDVEFVEASSAPIETVEAPSVPEYATEPDEEPVGSGASGEVRRGLFGR